MGGATVEKFDYLYHLSLLFSNDHRLGYSGQHVGCIPLFELASLTPDVHRNQKLGTVVKIILSS